MYVIINVSYYTCFILCVNVCMLCIIINVILTYVYTHRIGLSATARSSKVGHCTAAYIYILSLSYTILHYVIGVYDRASKQVHLFTRGDRRKKVKASILDLDDPDAIEA